MFGQTSTPLYKWLKFGCKILLHVLSCVTEVKVKLPTAEEVANFKTAVAENTHTALMSGAQPMGSSFSLNPQEAMTASLGTTMDGSAVTSSIVPLPSQWMAKFGLRC